MILRETRLSDDGGSNNSTTAVCERDVYPSACRWARQLTIIPQKGTAVVWQTQRPLLRYAEIGRRRLAPPSWRDQADLAVPQITSPMATRFFVTADTARISFVRLI